MKATNKLNLYNLFSAEGYAFLLDLFKLIFFTGNAIHYFDMFYGE